MRNLRQSCGALILCVAAAAFFWWASQYGHSTALASGGFAGTWCSPHNTQPYTITDRPTLIVTDWTGPQGAHYSGSQLVTDRWHETATLSSDGNKISWNNGKIWVRTTAGAQRCGPVATATPQPYRYLKWSSVEGPRPPIKVVGDWAAVMLDGSNVMACVSFINTSKLTATLVRFSWLFPSTDAYLVRTVSLDRKGTFLPDAEIQGWPDYAKWLAGHGHGGGYSDNCERWQIYNEEQRRAYSRLSHYSIRITHVDFANGSAWPGPSETSTPRK